MTTTHEHASASSTRTRLHAVRRSAAAHRLETPRAPFTAARPDASAWRARAACRTADPELFFPDRGDYATSAAALAICQRCPVVAACLDDAIATGEQFGIRGGMTARRRAMAPALQRRRARSRRVAAGGRQ